MAKIGIGTFTHYDLTQREILAGSVLSGDQQAVIQNELAIIAEQRCNIDYDPLNPVKFAQDESFLKGQMSILRVMLLRSKESEYQLQNLPRES